MKNESWKHENSILSSSGFYIFKSHSYIGETSDHIFIYASYEGQFCVEYKCSYSIKAEEVSIAQNRLDFLQKNKQ